MTKDDTGAALASAQQQTVDRHTSRQQTQILLLRHSWRQLIQSWLAYSRALLSKCCSSKADAVWNNPNACIMCRNNSVRCYPAAAGAWCCRDCWREGGPRTGTSSSPAKASPEAIKKAYKSGKRSDVGILQQAVRDAALRSMRSRLSLCTPSSTQFVLE